MAKSLLVFTTALGSATDTFIGVSGGGVGHATEQTTQYAVTHDAQFSNLRMDISANGSGLNTLTFRKNAADGNLVASRTGIGTASDLVHVDTAVAGDLVNYGLVDTGSDPTYRIVTCNVELDTGVGTFFRCGNADRLYDTASVTRFLPINGILQHPAAGTEANTQWRVRAYDRVDALQVRIRSNARTTDTVFKLRINGSDVASSVITVGAGMTGLFLVTDLDEALADGDLINCAMVTGTGTEEIGVDHVGATLLSSANASELWAHTLATVSRTASETPNYYVLGGGINSNSALADVELTPGFACDVTNLRCRANANTYTADATLTLYVNAEAAMTTAITAATTGHFENTEDRVTIGPTDKIGISIHGGTANSATFSMVGLTLSTVAVVNPSVAPTDEGRGCGIGFGPGMGAYSITERD